MPVAAFGGELKPSAPVDLDSLPATALRRMAAAGEELLEIHRILARTGDNVVGDLLRHEGVFYEWDHYPKGDVYDPHSHSQYYYHAHAADRRFDGEHGHFHSFLRPYGMPAGLKPAATVTRSPAEVGVAGGNEALSHLVAISMDDHGQPRRLFTVNRWVTGETWYRGQDVAEMLDCFSIDHVRPSWATNRWITAMVRLFRPQIAQLLLERDRTVEAWRRSHPSADVLEDRGLEVTSWFPVSLNEQVEAVQEALRGAES